MSYILHIETATPVCSVALSYQGEVLQFMEAHEPNMHAHSLTVFIDQVLKQQQLEFNQLDAVAVSMGPGSYTGLRIGVSTAKGLCYALDKPLIAVNTLEAMVAGFRAQQDVHPDALLMPMIDARRLEVFTAVFSDKGILQEETSAKIIDVDSLDYLLHGAYSLTLFGSGADKFADFFPLEKKISIIPSFLNSATQLVTAAYAKFQQQDFEDVAYFEPFYLKDFLVSLPKKKPLQ